MSDRKRTNSTDPAGFAADDSAEAELPASFAVSFSLPDEDAFAEALASERLPQAPSSRTVANIKIIRLYLFMISLSGTRYAGFGRFWRVFVFRSEPESYYIAFCGKYELYP